MAQNQPRRDCLIIASQTKGYGLGPLKSGDVSGAADRPNTGDRHVGFNVCFLTDANLVAGQSNQLARIFPTISTVPLDIYLLRIYLICIKHIRCLQMTNEAQFLAGYDATLYERPAVAVDLVLMSIVDGTPSALLIQRDEHPALGLWGLPGGFVGIDETLDVAARRVLHEKARMDDAYIEQLYTFGAVHRDPRMRVISVAYFALLPAERFAAALKANRHLTLAKIEVGWSGETGGPIAAVGDQGLLQLAFDHVDILSLSILRLRGKLDYSAVGFALLPPLFTLRQLQDVHEAILGVSLNKPAFRRRMLDKGWLQPTGEREAGASFRPAELYRFKP
jgi:8-oxo-dGTP diphosphatase